MSPVAIVGVGLMGGSLGLALRAHADARVIGVNTDAEALRVALAVGAISEAADSVEAAAAQARAVVLSAPVPRIPELARRALDHSAPGCVVTDLGSTKAGVMAALTPTDRARFIGGHPVCGGERTGVAFARQELFRGATWFLTPGPEARSDLFQRLHGLVASVGARPVAIDADVHDRLMALVSHLPHVLAGALVNQAAATAPGGREALRSAGPSFVDLTRVAGSNPPLWADILLANSAAVLRGAARLLGAASPTSRRPSSAATATGCWASWPTPARPAGACAGPRTASRPTPTRVIVGVPNRPGAISEIATALGHAHINIEDLSLRPGPPDGEGELVLLVESPAAAQEAVRLVGERGYRAREAR